MRRPKVSVLMSAYNNAEYLEQAVRSILHQSYSDFELIITDDHSSDNTAQIIERLASEDSRIRVQKNDNNLGLAQSLNNMINLAQGEYIARMDDDDIALPLRFERQVALLDSGEADLCGTWMQLIGGWRKRIIRYPIDDGSIRVQMLFQTPFAHPSIMIRSHLFKEKCRYSTDAHYAEDYDLWARLSPYVRMKNIPEVLYLYRLHNQQVSHTKNIQQWQTASRVRRVYLEQLNIKAEEQEKRIHGMVRYPSVPGSKNEVVEIEQWLVKLAGHYHLETGHMRIVADQWYRVCIRSTVFGLWTWRKYINSQLRRLYSPSKKQLIELFLLCILRLRYQSGLYKMLEQFSLS